MRNRKTKQQLVDDNEQAARIALYLPQLHAQKEKLEADLQELEHLALSGWGYADFHGGVNFAITAFSEVPHSPGPMLSGVLMYRTGDPWHIVHKKADNTSRKITPLRTSWTHRDGALRLSDLRV